VLLHGPDRGLIRERTDTLIRAVAGNPNDPFRVVELGLDDVRREPARLVDEAAALAFGGGRRVVIIRDASDRITEAVEALLQSTTASALVVLDGGDLPKRSTLRSAVEAAANAVLIGCYPEDSGELSETIRRALAAEGFSITEGALDALAAGIGPDRALVRVELEKLATYMGGGKTDRPAAIGLDDVLAVTGDGTTVSLNALAYGVCGGEVGALDRDIAAAWAQGLDAIAILRVLGQHLERLLQARTSVSQGRTPSQAMEGLRPAVIFKLQPAFRRQLEAWDEARLATALALVTAAEIDCKSTGMPQRLVCGRVLFRIAAAASARNQPSV
jgi:DNA polymerase-3 subunit delta